MFSMTTNHARRLMVRALHVLIEHTSIIGAQGAENGCRDCVTEFRFQLFWRSLRQGGAMSGSSSCFRISLPWVILSQVQVSWFPDHFLVLE